MRSLNRHTKHNKPYLYRLGILFIPLTVVLFSSRCGAQSTEEKRGLLVSVSRIAVIAPYFGTNTLLGEEPPKEPKSKPRPSLTLSPEQERQRQEYTGYLRKIEAKVREHLPTRLQKRTTLEIVTQEKMEETLKMLDLTPQKLFQNGGRIKGTKFPTGESEALAKLTRQVQADAILLVVLDEPRRTDKTLYVSPTGFYYNSAHVRAKGGFALYLANGTRVLQEPIEVLHPATKIGNRQFLLTDWIEAHEQLIESFLDELVRYLPAKAIR